MFLHMYMYRKSLDNTSIDLNNVDFHSEIFKKIYYSILNIDRLLIRYYAYFQLLHEFFS